VFISIFNSEFDLLLNITKTARKMKYSLNKEMNEKMENRNKSSVEFILIALVINVNGKSSLSLNAGFYHLRLRVECTLFVIYKAVREPRPYW
jgi:hypothetical protein